MALIDLWRKDRVQLSDKHIQQVIAFAGDGKLGDGSKASAELREYLSNIPSELIAKYANQCLQDSFPNSGLALQDIVNEIGRRLDFSVTHGRYRGTSSQPGNDGIWSDGKKHSIVVEVKTTDAYQIDLNTIAGYRQSLVKSGVIELDKSSMLIVVGRQEARSLPPLHFMRSALRVSKKNWMLL